VEYLGLIFLIVALVGLISESFYIGGKVRPWVYYLHGFTTRVFHIVGVGLSIHTSDYIGWGNLIYIIFMVSTVALLWYLQKAGMENYKQMRKSRQELDDLLDNWGK